MDRRMLSFILLFSQSEYILLTRLAIACQTCRGGASVYTSGLQAESSVRALSAKTGSEGGSSVALWLMVSWYSSDQRQILLLHGINILFPNRPFILTSPWWDFHVHEFQCNYITVTPHVNKLKEKKGKENAVTTAFIPEDVSVSSRLSVCFFNCYLFTTKPKILLSQA